MDNKKAITIQINRNQHDAPSQRDAQVHNASNQSSLEDYIRENHHPMDDDHVFQRQYTPDPGSFKKKPSQSFWKKYKSLWLSALTAIIIGSFLGFIMLKMFVDLDPEEMATNQNSTNGAVQTTGSTSEENSGGATGGDALELKSYPLFVIQAGVYSNQAAAEELITGLEQENVAAMIWQRDDQYHVFVGAETSHDASKQFASSSINTTYEIYAGKEWTTNTETASVSAEEKAWLTDLGSMIDQQLADGLDPSSITEWLQAKPENMSEKVQVVATAADEFANASDEQAKQVALLSIIESYEKLATN
ncbi:SPOR domain-containing protein [Gracilibacillus salinarum]|uniref:SPOR domain-containing protein n=1 Tax=Gracilibacillus salinarum TaxID=2932255 RepID=A0ABY4GPA7_9BACI|nr:SPOR domain-containing protein [Gracilibacillus salinarum]UOQ86157.1 SPOR domain-containing protein [Gracilibacillus salinarum]